MDSEASMLPRFATEVIKPKPESNIVQFSDRTTGRHRMDKNIYGWKLFGRTHLRKSFETPIKLAVSGALATGLAFGAHAAADKVFGSEDFSSAVNNNPAMKIELKTGMPSQNLPIVDDRNSQKPIVEKNIDDGVSEQDIKNVIASVPKEYRENAKVALPLIAKALKERGIDSEAVFAFAVARSQHETLGWEKMREIDAAGQAKKYNYDGGADYAGGGPIHLTGKENYEKIGKMIGQDLVNNPELIEDPWIGSQALAAYFEWRGTASYAKKLDFINASEAINPLEDEIDEDPFKSVRKIVEKDAFDYLAQMRP